jgi:hypothetical protein
LPRGVFAGAAGIPVKRHWANWANRDTADDAYGAW